MFRPNRIGDHDVLDLSAADFLLPQTNAENLASLGTTVLHNVQTDSAVLGDPVTTINFSTGDAALAWVIGTRKSWSFGRFVTGAVLNNRSMMYSYKANVMMKLSANASQSTLNLHTGIANATSVTVDKTAAVNPMDTMSLLKVGFQANGGLIYYLNARGTFLNTIQNGGASGLFDTNPLGLWFSFTNYATSVNILHCRGSISLYRYSQDLDTFDPTR